MKTIQIKTMRSDTEASQCEAMWHQHELEQAHTLRSAAITMRVFASKTTCPRFVCVECDKDDVQMVRNWLETIASKEQWHTSLTIW